MLKYSMFNRRNSEEIYKQACDVLPGGVSRNTVYRKPFPHYAESAYGCLIIDVDGIEKIDFANNMASLIHGHAHPAIVNAVTEQLHRGTAYTLASEIEVSLAQLLCDRVPGVDKIRFVNSGTEAVMAMIKTARAFTGKCKIAKAEGAYHGSYDFAEVSQTATPMNWGDENNPQSVPVAFGTPPGVLEDVIVIPFNDVEKTIRILNKHAHELACVLIDPVPHRVGMMPATEEFIEAIYNWTREYKTLLAFDEVVSFRVGYSGAQEMYTVRPDLTALGKIIGGGFPVGAFGGKADVMKVLDPREDKILFPHSGTFSANPITMMAGFTAMELFDKTSVLKINSLTKIAVNQILEAAKIADVPVSITGAGSMFRIHLTEVPPKSYREAFQTKETLQTINKLIDYIYFKENILLVNTFSCMLSTVITTKEVDKLSEAMFKAFVSLKPEIEKANEMSLNKF